MAFLVRPLDQPSTLEMADEQQEEADFIKQEKEAEEKTRAEEAEQEAALIKEAADEKAAAARELRDDTPTTSDDAPSSPRKGFVKASELLAAEAEGDAGEVLEDDATKRADAAAAAAKEADSVFVVTLALAFALVWLCVRPMVKLGWLVARPFLEPVAKILTKPFGALVA